MQKPVLLREDGRRLSGRGERELREMRISVGLLTKARGSAFVEWGRNKVLAAVHGPREVFPKHLTDPYKALISFRYAMTPFSSLEEHGRAGPTRRSVEISKVVKHVFENIVLVHEFPKTSIDISAEVLQSDGGTRVAAINAASLALIDAGIPVKDVVSAVSVGKVQGKLVVDLDKDEDNFGESDMPVAFTHRTGEIVLWQMDGMLSREELAQALEMAFEATKEIREKQLQALREKYLQTQAENNSGA